MSMYDDDFGLDDDDFGLEEEDEFGISERRVARLMKRRARLQALLPISGPRRQRRIMRRLSRIDKVLARSGYTAQVQAGQAAVAAAGIEGIGSLQFQAMSPPGLGRLLRLPFYPNVAHTGSTTAGGDNAASAVNPIMIENPALIAALQACNTAHTLQTPQISWATLRLVGFETQQSQFKGIGNPGPVMGVADLQIGGGANLFTFEDFGDAGIFDADQPEFCGLRDYPIIKSPNTSTVSVIQLGDLAAETVTFSASLICEALVDDNYGAHIPGPYARKGAMVRQGGSFV